MTRRNHSNKGGILELDTNENDALLAQRKLLLNNVEELTIGGWLFSVVATLASHSNGGWFVR